MCSTRRLRRLYVFLHTRTHTHKTQRSTTHGPCTHAHARRPCNQLRGSEACRRDGGVQAVSLFFASPSHSLIHSLSVVARPAACPALTTAAAAFSPPTGRPRARSTAAGALKSPTPNRSRARSLGSLAAAVVAGFYRSFRRRYYDSHRSFSVFLSISICFSCRSAVL